MENLTLVKFGYTVYMQYIILSQNLTMDKIILHMAGLWRIDLPVFGDAVYGLWCYNYSIFFTCFDRLRVHGVIKFYKRLIWWLLCCCSRCSSAFVYIAFKFHRVLFWPGMQGSAANPLVYYLAGYECVLECQIYNYANVFSWKS